MNSSLTKRQARRALLAQQGLWPPRSMRGWQDVSAFFARVGSMQFDPVDVAGISPEISLNARVKGFRREHLQQWLYGSRVLCDAWDKNACLSPVADRPMLLAQRRPRVHGWRVYIDAQGVEQAMPAVRERLMREGPLDIGQFNGEPAMREALERMLSAGEVALHHREGRRRYFDLAEKLLPHQGTRRHTWTQDEQDDWFVLRRTGAVGLLWKRRSDAFLGLHDLPASRRARAYERLQAAGRLACARVEGIKEPLYYRVGDEGMFAQRDGSAKACLLGPLDNLLWDRNLIAQLFGFSYTWEIYVPPQDRKYGSYAMPVLYGDRFAGRIQLAQAGGALAVENWWPERDMKITKGFAREVDIALRAHGAMLGATPPAPFAP